MRLDANPNSVVETYFLVIDCGLEGEAIRRAGLKLYIRGAQSSLGLGS